MRKVEYKTGDVTVQSKEFTELPGEGKIRLNNQHDALEFLNYSLSYLIAAISELNDSIATLRDDIRQVRLGNEAFVYGEKVAESDEVDHEELLSKEGDE